MKERGAVGMHLNGIHTEAVRRNKARHEHSGWMNRPELYLRLVVRNSQNLLDLHLLELHRCGHVHLYVPAEHAVAVDLNIGAVVHDHLFTDATEEPATGDNGIGPVALDAHSLGIRLCGEAQNHDNETHDPSKHGSPAFHWLGPHLFVAGRGGL